MFNEDDELARLVAADAADTADAADAADAAEPAPHAAASARQREECAALERAVLARDRATLHAHHDALERFRRSRRRVTLATSLFVAFQVARWVHLYAERNAILEEENWNLQSWTAVSFSTLFVSAAVAGLLLFWWRRTLRSHPGTLVLESLPNEQLRHPAFSSMPVEPEALGPKA